MSRLTRTDRILTREQLAAVQQPLDYKTGYTNPHFNKLYGEKNNPYAGTERDSKNKRKYR